MIYAVKKFEHYKYRLNMVLKRLQMTISIIIVGIYNYMMYKGLVIIKFNSDYTKGPEIVEL